MKKGQDPLDSPQQVAPKFPLPPAYGVGVFLVIVAVAVFGPGFDSDNFEIRMWASFAAIGVIFTFLWRFENGIELVLTHDKVNIHFGKYVGRYGALFGDTPVSVGRRVPNEKFKLLRTCEKWILLRHPKVWTPFFLHRYWFRKHQNFELVHGLDGRLRLVNWDASKEGPQ